MKSRNSADRKVYDLMRGFSKEYVVLLAERRLQ